MKQMLVVLLLCLTATGVGAQGYKQVNDIGYTRKTDAYSQERLKLDVYYPEAGQGCPVVVWFHGGGLEGGNKEIPARLKPSAWFVKGLKGTKVESAPHRARLLR